MAPGRAPFFIVLLAVALMVTAAAFIVFRDQLESEIVLGVLGILSMVGIFFLVSVVIGFVEVMPQSRSDVLARGFLETAIPMARS